MSKSFPIIDVFTHILPDKYRKALYSKAQRSLWLQDLEAHHDNRPATNADLELRFSLVQGVHEGIREVLTIKLPPLEMVAKPSDAVGLAQIANDEMTELVAKHPDRFLGAVACLPLNDMDAALIETKRAIEVLKMKGVQIQSPCDGKPLDSPEFLPLYEMMTKYDLPIWIHPVRGREIPDYKDESYSKYRLHQRIGWPYETTSAMLRLVSSGVLERYPTLKIITHHGGGMLPYQHGRAIGAGSALD
ncbi:amidohydrolase family protein, partial [Chloroflexota bacterium]